MRLLFLEIENEKHSNSVNCLFAIDLSENQWNWQQNYHVQYELNQKAMHQMVVWIRRNIDLTLNGFFFQKSYLILK